MIQLKISFGTTSIGVSFNKQWIQFHRPVVVRNRFFNLVKFRPNIAAIVKGCGTLRIDLYCCVIVRNRFICIPQISLGIASIDVGHGISWIQICRCIILFNGLLGISNSAKCYAIPIVGPCLSGVA